MENDVPGESDLLFEDRPRAFAMSPQHLRRMEFAANSPLVRAADCADSIDAWCPSQERESIPFLLQDDQFATTAHG